MTRASRLVSNLRYAFDTPFDLKDRIQTLMAQLGERDAALADANLQIDMLRAASSKREQEAASELAGLRALHHAISEFDDPDPSVRDPDDRLVSPQSVRTKMIDGFVEGWGPAAHRVTQQLQARFPDIEDDDFWAIADRALPYTALSVQRLFSIYQAVRYVVAAGVPGDVVECGVFKGGSAVMIAQTFAHFRDLTRRIFLFDTFKGWPTPTDADTDFLGQEHRQLYEEDRRRSEEPGEARHASIYRLDDFFDRTRNTILSNTDYPADRILFVRGLVEETLPHPEISSLAILRLDTDYYESTAWEMKVLWPMLTTNGVLLIDDYGQFHGARKAVDEHLARHAVRGLLHRDDVTGRSMVKISA